MIEEGASEIVVEPATTACSSQARTSLKADATTQHPGFSGNSRFFRRFSPVRGRPNDAAGNGVALEAELSDAPRFVRRFSPVNERRPKSGPAEDNLGRQSGRTSSSRPERRLSPVGVGRPLDKGEASSIIRNPPASDVHQRSESPHQCEASVRRAKSAVPRIRRSTTAGSSDVEARSPVASRARSQSPPAPVAVRTPESSSASTAGAATGLATMWKDSRTGGRGDVQDGVTVSSSSRPATSGRRLNSSIANNVDTLSTSQKQRPAVQPLASRSDTCSSGVGDKAHSLPQRSPSPIQVHSRNAKTVDQRDHTSGMRNSLSPSKGCKQNDMRNHSAPTTALERLHAKGISIEAARVALHATAGDELRAVELCMAGLGSDPPCQGHVSTSSERKSTSAGRAKPQRAQVQKSPPSPQFCYICGASCLTSKALDIHTKACKRQFELHEAKLPASQRRPMLEKSELPEGFSCLEKYYESITAFTSKARRNKRQCSLDEWMSSLNDDLPRCPPVCPDDNTQALLAGKACVTPDSDTRVSHLQLEKCSGCGRSFPPKLLQAHMKKCSVLLEVSATEKSIRERIQLKQTYGNVSAKVFNPPGSMPGASPTTSFRQSKICTSAVLVERGLIAPVADEAEAHLRSELERAIPGAEFAAAFRVLSAAQKGVYDAMKASLQAQHASEEPPEERELWHGTSWAIIEKILQHGFNRIFAGRHGKLLGVATYFSNELAYSHRFCDRGGREDQTKVVIMARVLIGRYCKGKATDKEPPLIHEDGQARYDSTVDKVEDPQIFAVFKDFQAIPLYLLEFRS